MLSVQGFTDSHHEHVLDEPDLLERELGRNLEEANVLILSGGVSMGQADFVPGVLEALGVRMVFHKISQRPGKPMWFGIGPRNQAVFALPGNPVSSLVCCRQYVLPALFSASGREAKPLRYAMLDQDVEFGAKLTCFLPVRTKYVDDGSTRATPAPTNTSGDFTSLGGTDGYVELRKEECLFPAGTVVPLHPWADP
jgi:molybdopterin molybdotransferase